MSNTQAEKPTFFGYAVREGQRKITDELPPVFGYPLKFVAYVMRVIVTFTGFLMAFTFGAVVVIRYGFGGDLFAYEEWLLGISIVGFFAGAVLASSRNLHINADILGIVIHDPKLIWWRGFIVLVIELVVILFLFYACYMSLLDDFSFPRLRSTPVLRIPFVSWRIAIMCAFGFMALFTSAYLYVHIRKGLGLPLRSDTLKEAAK
ncbi:MULTISPECIES: TRAP transporter small permease [unclassified Meridianimarinicoccus]|uniref:TRAP transporter small permease n=1 Tax=unclassified Meridianimarinicoccus TaxID=2923344 RepID=UPI0018673007|nr:TRAP transporter small permease subunit [Fluviibacterium sp. MJW13]